MSKSFSDHKFGFSFFIALVSFSIFIAVSLLFSSQPAFADTHCDDLSTSGFSGNLQALCEQFSDACESNPDACRELIDESVGQPDAGTCDENSGFFSPACLRDVLVDTCESDPDSCEQLVDSAVEQSRSNGACPGDLFGIIPPWSKGLCDGGDIQVDDLNDLLKIGFNIVEIVLVVMVIAAVLVFLVGAVRLIGSSGKPDSIALASKTMVNAVIGLALGLSAGSLVSFFSSTFAGAADGSAEGLATLPELIIEVGAAVAVVMIVKAGIQYTTSAGDSGKIAGAKGTILWTVVGIIILVSAYLLMSMFIGSL